MPNVVGQNINQARSVLASRGIKTAYATEQVVGAVSDVIIRQDPAPGAIVNSSLTATLTGAIGIAGQPLQRPVPNVVGRQVRDAAALLTKYGFRAGRISDDDDANVEAGTVVTQNPTGGQEAQTGTPVALSVRTTRVRVPSVLTLAESDARQQIAASGLRVSTAEPRDDVAKPGTVIDQSPAARTPVPRGSEVAIVVAREAPLAMPNLIGLSRATATSLISQRGLVLDVVDTATTQIRPDTVVLQDPAQNRPVRAGDHVRFTVGAQQKLVAVPIVRSIVAIVVTPARAKLRFGDSVRFTATATMNDGSRERARVTWSTRGGGTIRPDGMFTAVGDSGSHDVVATAVGGVAGTATVRVALAAILPLPPTVPPVPPVPPWWERLWILWVALGASILAVVAKLLWPPPLPPITCALRTKPPSFSIDEDGSGRGLALSLSLTNDAGVQGIRETPFNAP
jgi:beta-lactam-binding protein with PASTA domain